MMNQTMLIEGSSEYIATSKEANLRYKKSFMHTMNEYALSKSVITQDIFLKAKVLIDKIQR